MSAEMGFNPFLGPRPYSGSEDDRRLFTGRNEVTRRLMNRILAHACVTLHGPSGAGKSSLMQAGVIPRLKQEHDFRAVSVDGWPAGEAPLPWLARAMFAQLELGNVPEALPAAEALELAVELAEERSERPVLIFLDQLEQLLLPGHAVEETEEFLEGVDALARKTSQKLCIVLSLREDYLGRFRDRARGWRTLLEGGFRLGPLTVGELLEVVLHLATLGQPSQSWVREETRALMLQVRMPGQLARDEAEVQTAFAQIVCRALWAERAEGSLVRAVDAENILHGYLETTLAGLGALTPAAQRLLEEHLVAADGSRALLTEQEARAALPPEQADTVLDCLERAAVLRAEEHYSSRYFELGHDWLARKVFESKQQREQKAEQLRLLLERRKLRLMAAGSVGLVVLGTLFVWGVFQTKRAEEQAQRARFLGIMAGARELLGRGQIARSGKLLLEITQPAQVKDWLSLSNEVLGFTQEVALPCPGCFRASFSPDGQYIVTIFRDKARVWRVDGQGESVVLRGHEGRVGSAAFSPDGQRVVTASEDKTARVWRVDGQGAPVVLRGHEGEVWSAAFSPDGQRVVTASVDATARVWRVDGQGEPVVLRGHEGAVLSAAFSPDGQRVVTASEDATAWVWRVDGQGAPVVLRGHEGPVGSAAFSPDGQRVVTASTDGTARLWSLSVDRVRQRLREANKDCLSAGDRMTYVGETEALAIEHYEACERSYGRVPLSAAAVP
ncbi:MAG TPA: hypothetical protein VFZ09_45580 [Archangium sp.]|uniref:nSTAND1 domain-containing NTPase n=1 Tax=Archangium sp. TaxID=1872627 RepID=UPI002E3789F8|nr:hypothetical protein [Archangium sp.]HEX5753552.1 hypothetical protein [Archangium sp.]